MNSKNKIIHTFLISFHTNPCEVIKEIWKCFEFTPNKQYIEIIIKDVFINKESFYKLAGLG